MVNAKARGAKMTNRVAAAFLATALFVASCATGVSSRSEVRASQAEAIASLPGDITFLVGYGGAEAGPMLEDVTVSLVSREGAFVELGATNTSGALTVPKRAFSQGVVLLFSLEGYFDGAWKVRYETLRDFDERFITLAPFAMR
jgi:hypothetical protein